MHERKYNHTLLIDSVPNEYRTSQVVLAVKNPSVNAGDIRDMGSIPGSGKILWRRARHSTPAFFPGESHGQRSLAGYSPWSCKELDTTEVT